MIANTRAHCRILLYCRLAVIVILIYWQMYFLLLSWFIYWLMMIYLFTLDQGLFSCCCRLHPLDCSLLFLLSLLREPGDISGPS